MAIGPGARVGPYEATALIGEGGMGKVWRARHASLKRDDAVKVLPRTSTASKMPKRRRLVMELVEGPTLVDHIAYRRRDEDAFGCLSGTPRSVTHSHATRLRRSNLLAR